MIVILDCLGAGGGQLLLSVKVEPHQLVGLGDEHDCLAVAAPVEVKEGTGEAQVDRGQLLQLLSIDDCYQIDHREASVGAKGHKLRVRGNLEVLYPSIRLVGIFGGGGA
jgi:hypothetical protein